VLGARKELDTDAVLRLLEVANVLVAGRCLDSRANCTGLLRRGMSMKQRTRRLPRPRAIAACGVVASLVGDVARASELFAAPWLGFNAGSSAYPGNPQPFERDPTALATADFNGDGYVDVAVANYEYGAPGGGTDGMSGFAVLFGGPDRRFSEPTHVTVSNRGCWDSGHASSRTSTLRSTTSSEQRP
jgi:hypothetical protein